ncbi:hypothetical protein H310_09780 [Aphanomyces invadans]|uniref:Apple domain-containing protein n=1 Tax=Aphanomyces invadans TaxID=157072 RepID=A0A024TS16_9STRA|nr:hypothetical protein H310_09780 [Aphanomyces invadans]ETV96915.1 hypothetical protein H310_09780 [Aphanomyces invadans]|eukprot:XP_008874161.1 hypothetical protein H310_09780 [Aphanomyces invadans]
MKLLVLAAAASVSAATMTGANSTTRTFNCSQGKDFRLIGDVSNIAKPTAQDCQAECGANCNALTYYNGVCYLKWLTLEQIRTQLTDNDQY